MKKISVILLLFACILIGCAILILKCRYVYFIPLFVAENTEVIRDHELKELADEYIKNKKCTYVYYSLAEFSSKFTILPEGVDIASERLLVTIGAPLTTTVIELKEENKITNYTSYLFGSDTFFQNPEIDGKIYIYKYKKKFVFIL